MEFTTPFPTYPTNISSSDGEKIPKGPQFFVVGVLAIPVSLIGTMGSLTTLYLLAHFNRKQSSTNALITNLCVATFLLCGTSSLFDAYTMITGTPGSSPLSCIVFAFLHFLWLSVSAHSHAAIAMHRLVAVLSSESSWMNSSSKALAVSLVSYTWLVPFLVLVFPLAETGAAYGFSKIAFRCSVVTTSSPSYAIVLKIMNSFVPLAVMSLCYLVICFVVLRSKTRFNLDDSALRGQGATGRRLLRLKAEFRVTKIAFITCAWFTVCYIPSSIHGLIVSQVSELQSPLAQCFVLMTWIGCATTPVLYMALSTEMRSLAVGEGRRLRHRISTVLIRHNSVHQDSRVPSPYAGPFLLPSSAGKFSKSKLQVHSNSKSISCLNRNRLLSIPISQVTQGHALSVT